MKDQSKGAFRPTKTGISFGGVTCSIHCLKASIAACGGRPLSSSSSSVSQVISSAAGINSDVVGLSSHEKFTSVSDTRHAPILSKLYFPGTGPEASISTEMKTSFFTVMALTDPLRLLSSGI